MNPNAPEMAVAPSVREESADGTRGYSAHVLQGLCPGLPGWMGYAQAIFLPTTGCLRQNGYV